METTEKTKQTKQLDADTICSNLIVQLELEGHNVKLWYTTIFKTRKKNTYELTIFFNVNGSETNITLYLETNIEKLNDIYIYQLALKHIEKRIENINKGSY